MTNSETPVEILFQKVEAYSKTTIELLKLKAIDKSAEVVSTLASQFIISIVVSMFVLCFNIALALFIGEAMGKTYLGFFVVAGCYLLLAIIIYLYRQSLIKTPVTNSIIKQILDKLE